MAGVELCATVGNTLAVDDLEPLQRVLNTYDIQHRGNDSLTGEIYARIARKRPPTLDSAGKYLDYKQNIFVKIQP